MQATGEHTTHETASGTSAAPPYQLLVEGLWNVAVIMLDDSGRIVSWNTGAERLTGYDRAEVLGRPASLLYPARDVVVGGIARTLFAATRDGHHDEVGWRLRRDGSRFWAHTEITPLHDRDGRLRGFAELIRAAPEDADAGAPSPAAEGLEARVRERTAELAAAARELEAFSYSVSHDLRAPLRAMDGFSKVLLERVADRLDDQEQGYLRRIRAAAQRMSQLLDALLNLSRLTRSPMTLERIDLSGLAEQVVTELREQEPQRSIAVTIQPGLTARGDPRLLRVALENLIGNAWKFTRRSACPTIEVFACDGEFHVRDNGVGFDPATSGKLFTPFQRLPNAAPFEGTGIGLATVQRVISRHHGHLRAEGRPDGGATFSFTLGGAPNDDGAADAADS